MLTKNEAPKNTIFQWFPFATITLLYTITNTILPEQTRTSIIFGPNVYYRILGCLFVFQFIFSINNLKDLNSRFQKYTSIFLLIISFYMTVDLLIKTGSRGAAIIIFLLSLMILFAFFKIEDKKVKNIVNILITFLVIIITTQWLERITIFFQQIISSRTFLFYDPTSSSTAISSRVDYLNNFLMFFTYDDFLAGEGSYYKYSYPHNLYLDILYNAGIIPFITILIFSFLCIYLLLLKKVSLSSQLLMLIFFPIYLGSMVSGTVYDNYSVISLIVFIPVKNLYFMFKQGKPSFKMPKYKNKGFDFKH